jgi:hypothetical protein
MRKREMPILSYAWIVEPVNIRKELFLESTLKQPEHFCPPTIIFLNQNVNQGNPNFELRKTLYYFGGIPKNQNKLFHSTALSGTEPVLLVWDISVVYFRNRCAASLLVILEND